MKNLLNQTYKDLAIPYFKEVFLTIDDVLISLGIPYYLVGANAIALELLAEKFQPSRGTKDIDFAIMISHISEFENVVTQLEGKGFFKVKAPWTVYHAEYNVAIDILPFGQIEESDTIHFNNRVTDLHVLGFKEVLEESKTIQIEDKIARIPPLFGMVILKLIAWNDRPEERGDDLLDILTIIKKYFLINLDDIYDNHFDLLDKYDDLENLLVSARVLGRKSQIILNKSERVKNRILQILQSQITDPRISEIAINWAAKNDWTIDFAIRILSELLSGMTDDLGQDQADFA